jgi:hypothetical protein
MEFAQDGALEIVAVGGVDAAAGEPDLAGMIAQMGGAFDEDHAVRRPRVDRNGNGGLAAERGRIVHRGATSTALSALGGDRVPGGGWQHGVRVDAEGCLRPRRAAGAPRVAVMFILLAMVATVIVRIVRTIPHAPGH